MEGKAIALVNQYLDAIMDHSNPDAKPTLFIEWQAWILQHFKCVIATTLPYGMRFELTYDSEEDCWYFDVYRKVENRVIANGV